MATGGSRFLAQRLRHRIDIQALAVDQDDSSAGGTGYTSEAFASILADGEPLIPAEKVALSGNELVAAAAIHAEATTRFTIGWRPVAFKPSMRIVHDGVAFDIKAIVPDQTERRWLQILCGSGVTLG